MTTPRFWHGGVPDLRVGDLIEPGHDRRQHDGCPWCAARANGDSYGGMDGPSHRADRVYLTTEREYARFYASLWGYGDLYRVDPVGEAEPSPEDTVPSWMVPAARVIAVYQRAVLLTNTQRRALHRLWTHYDRLATEETGASP